MINCFLCTQSFAATQAYFSHLRLNHAIHHTGVEVPCKQDDCPHTSTSFRSLKAHILREHSDFINFDTSRPKSNHVKGVCSHFQAGLDGSESESEMEISCEASVVQPINLTESFISFVNQLQSKANLSLTNVQIVTENMKVFLNDVVQYSCAEVGKLSQCAKNDVLLSDNVKQCVAAVSEISNCLDGVDSEYKRWTYMKRSGFLIEPVQVTLGSRMERKYVASLGRRDNVQIADTMQYVPIELLLGMIMLDKSSAAIISEFKQHCLKIDRELINHYFQTETYKKHQFFIQHSDAFAVHLYVDGFEVVNPLGSHTSVHKMEALYMIVQNFPGEYQSKLSSIVLVALWYAMDVKKYNGYDKILAPVVSSLQKLESENGATVTVRGQELVVRACLVLVSADNLGYNSLFGFVESFSARKFCRFCETTRDTAETCYYENQFQLRSRQSYNAAVAEVGSSDYSVTETGIKRGCILNQLAHYHVIDNMCVDIMHDILEGVAPHELSLILEALRIEKFITVDQLNSAIIGFDYSSADINSRPPDLSSFTSLKMSASEMWCFLRNLPRFIGHLIPRDEPNWKLLLMFLEICDIIFSPVVTVNLCSYLSHLIADHHSYFKELYPNSALLPKHHFMVHYPRCLITSGPAIRY